jgi:hypothetical protein
MTIQNTAIARKNLDRYPWAQAIVDGWQEDVAFALQQDRAFFERMMPDLTPWSEYGQNCPACVGRLSTMGESGLYEWNITEPDRLLCKYCKTEYPNAEYPESGQVRAPRMGQTFTFYLNENERAHPEDRVGTYAYRWVTWPVHTSWSGILRAKQGGWCVNQILPLARLYALKGDLACAERAVWIMDAMAQRYPNWLYHSYDGTVADCPPAEAAAELGRHPRGGRFSAEAIITAFEGRHRDGDHAALFNGFWGAGRFGCSGSDGGTVLKIAMAYDLIRGATDVNRDPVISPLMDRRIRADLILAGCEDAEHWNEINNKCGPARALSGLVGRMFDRPKSVRRAIAGFEALLIKGFHADGFCTESPSYSAMFLNLMRQIPDLLIGYSDPQGYIPEQGERLVEYNPYRDMGHYRLALESMTRMLDPKLDYPVIGDTHAGGGLEPIHAEVLAAHYGPHYAGLLEVALGAPLATAGGAYALWYRDPDLNSTTDLRAGTISDLRAGTTPDLPLRTEWFPAWHVGVLRGGDARSEGFYFNAYEQGGHRHYDTLGISYISRQTELAADRGYIWDDPRGAWTKGTFSHNIVTVDGQNQNVAQRRSRLELFGRGAGVEVVRAAAQAYEQCDLYQRTCVLVQAPDGGTYAVDFFRVAGGRSHHYGFHCNGVLSHLKGVSMAPLEEAGSDLEEWLKWVKNVRVAKTSGPVCLTWAYEAMQMDLILLNDIGRLLVADAPGWRACHGSQIDAPPVQQILAERTDGRPSDYVAVMVPYSGGESPVRETRLVNAGSGAMAVEVRFDKRTDYILSAPDYAERQYGPVSMAGRCGYLCVDAEGDPLKAYLLDGTHLQYENFELRLAQPHSHFSVEKLEGRDYVLDRDIPDPVLTQAHYLLAGDTGYDIEAMQGRSIRVRDYPAVTCEALTLLHASEWAR